MQSNVKEPILPRKRGVSDFKRTGFLPLWEWKQATGFSWWCRYCCCYCVVDAFVVVVLVVVVKNCDSLQRKSFCHLPTDHKSLRTIFLSFLIVGQGLKLFQITFSGIDHENSEVEHYSCNFNVMSYFYTCKHSSNPNKIC